MSQFVVTVEDVSFVAPVNGSAPLLELEAVQMQALFDTHKASGDLDDAIVGIAHARVVDDDSSVEQDGEVKCFISIGLIVEAEDSDEAEEIDVPETMLNNVAEALSIDAAASAEGNWEILETDDYDAPAPAAAKV